MDCPCTRLLSPNVLPPRGEERATVGGSGAGRRPTKATGGRATTGGDDRRPKAGGARPTPDGRQALADELPTVAGSVAASGALMRRLEHVAGALQRHIRDEQEQLARLAAKAAQRRAEGEAGPLQDQLRVERSDWRAIGSFEFSLFLFFFPLSNACAGIIRIFDIKIRSKFCQHSGKSATIH